MTRKSTIEDMRVLAESRGGKCLSSEYINNHTRLQWQCQEGHVWENTPAHIKSGQWCPKCGKKERADTQRGSIQEMQEIAQQRGGTCLSPEYINAHTKLKWQCQEGHMWENTPAHIKSGQWCPRCAAQKNALERRLTIEEMQEIARQRGGTCLSTQYVNISTKLKWQCKEGHIWEAVPNTIRKGHWCPKCARQETANKRKPSIEEMQELAKQRGGTCLSTEYINAKTKLRWQCKEGHIWETIPTNIKQGKWCPVCARPIITK